MTEKEFTSIVDSTKGIVLSAIEKFLFSNFAHAIDDVVQETYLRAYKSLKKGKFKGDSSHSTWLYVIARNEALRMNSKLTREEFKKSKIKTDMIDYPDFNEENIFEKLSLDKMKKIIAHMPVKYSTVFKLYLQGYKLTEIAETLQLSSGTIKSRTFRGKKMILKLMTQGASYE